ncbi:exonuclease domain-containing protein [Pseudovibrio sp. POLY-S9]|uniref:3'-5' exonuclease n=1 Tax=Pseudovibrio sp. POLY-S9 TaxID=1576596 RepID=UPI00070A1413|nr:exonuclease domain-containing protein [Pseudovibrio sp. POLY-S9]
MLTGLSLRFRIFLLFAGVAAASCAVVGAALYFGYTRIAETTPASGFLLAGILSIFGLLAISVSIWLLFDENVAKPVQRLSAAIRTTAHANVDASIDFEEAKYLGDLAPAAHAVAWRLTNDSADTEELVSDATAQLASEREQLALLLTEIPVAIVLVSPAHKIMLYDGQAADILGQVHVPRLSASIFDYFIEEEVRAAYDQLIELKTEIAVDVKGARGNLNFQLRLKKLRGMSGYMILIDDATARIAPEAPRPLIYDFEAAQHHFEKEIEERSLRDLSFVVFDTETTGLMPNKDDIVQIGAVRVVNGRIIPGETVDQLVNPGRLIPAASTGVHRITDDMVADAPDPVTAISEFHAFAKDSVIVAHNAPFDMAFLHRYGHLSGHAWDHPILDTVLLSAVVFGADQVHTLDALCTRLGIEIPIVLRHTALGDAQATAQALCKLLPLLSSHGFNTFGEVIEQTRKHGRLLKDMN